MESLLATGPSIVKNVVDLYECDVFVYGRNDGDSGKAIREAFGKRVKSVYIGPQLTEPEIQAELALSKNYEELKKACAGSNMIQVGVLFFPFPFLSFTGYFRAVR
jgi:hypothetical protein